MRQQFGELEGHDAYELLGVAEDAPLKTILQAHKEQIKSWHPDRHRNSGTHALAEEKTRLLNAARDILTNRRKDYDAHRRQPASDAEEIIDPWDAPDDPSHIEDPWQTAAAGPGFPRPAPHPSQPWPPPGNVSPNAPWSPTAPPPYVPPPGYGPPAPPARRKRPLRRVLLLVGGFYLLLIVVQIARLFGSSGNAVPEPQVAIPKQFAGSWAGPGRGEDSKEAWNIRLTLPEGKRSGQHTYVEYNCGGTLIPLRLEGEELILYEHINEPTNNCKDGEIHVTRRKGGKLNLAFYGTDGDKSTKSTVTAVVTRQKSNNN